MIKKDKMTDNTKIVYEIIILNPGVNCQKISQSINKKKTSTDYHLELLLNENLIESLKIGHTYYYFQKNSNQSLHEKRILCFLRNEKTNKILKFLVKKEKSQFNIMYLVYELDLTHAIIKYHLQKMMKYNIIQSDNKIRNPKYFLTEESKKFLKYLLEIEK